MPIFITLNCFEHPTRAYLTSYKFSNDDTSTRHKSIIAGPFFNSANKAGLIVYRGARHKPAYLPYKAGPEPRGNPARRAGV